MKRGESGLSFVIGVDKPSGMTSHDVVSRVRRIFGEKRVGHTGTLDPLASGVLQICVGSAARLDAYFTDHDKHYEVDVVFGAATDTDDSDGCVIRTGRLKPELSNEQFAQRCVEALIGPMKQIPPAYSAIKVNGRKACDEARAGRIIHLDPRDIEIYDARLIAIIEPDEKDSIIWRIAFHVSRGTYIRALARDLGNKLHCPAHVGALRRTRLGKLTLDECYSLEGLAEVGIHAALDPVELLGYRFVFANDDQMKKVHNGAYLAASSVEMFEWRRSNLAQKMCACTSGIQSSCITPFSGEIVSVISENKLAALYSFNEEHARYVPACVFHPEVIRGALI